MRVIGLCGRIGAGKSTVAEMLRRTHAVVPFATPLKAMALALGVPYDNIYGTQEQKAEPLDILCGKSSRFALQTIGTEWGRALIGEDIWVNAWKKLARETMGLHLGVIADDVRFPNEVAAVRALGGVVVRILRPGLAGGAAHASEQSDDLNVDFEIVNRGSVDDMRRKVVGLMLPRTAAAE